MEIIPLEHKEDILQYYHIIKEIPLIDSTSEQVLANVLLGNYQCELGYKEDKLIGLVIYYITGTLCFVVGTWARHNMKGFPDMFFKQLKKAGLSEVRCMTNGKIPDYDKRVKMTKLWEVYGRKL